MKIRKKCALVAVPGFSAAALVIVAPAALGQAINVPNYTFSSPAVTSSGYTGGVSTYIADWTTYGDSPVQTNPSWPAASSGTQIWPNAWNASAPYYENIGYFSNAAGPQCASIATTSSQIAAYGSPGYVDGMYQVLPTTYAAGKSYTLSVDVGVSPGAYQPDKTDPFTYALFSYNPSNPPNPTSPSSLNVLATGTITEANLDSSPDSNDLPIDWSVLQTVTISTPALDPSNLAVGQEIGMEIYTAPGSTYAVDGVTVVPSSATAGGYYDFDNMQLSATEVPEPASIVLMVGVSTALLGRRSLRKRTR